MQLETQKAGGEMLTSQNSEIKTELLTLQEEFTKTYADCERFKREIKARDELITQIEEQAQEDKLNMLKDYSDLEIKH